MDKTYPETKPATQADINYLIKWCTENGITVKKLKLQPKSYKKHW